MVAMARPNYAALRELVWDHPEDLLAALFAGVDPTSPLRPIVDGIVTGGSIQQNWRADFVVAGGLDPAKWVDKSVTPGDSTVTVAGGNLVITSGVGVNQERIIESVPTFSIGTLMRISSQLSARTPNVEVRFELASVDPATGDTDADSLASWALLGGDTVTQARYEVAIGLTRGGTTQQSVAATVNTSASQNLYEITLTNDEALFSDRLPDSTAARGHEFIKTQNLPSPDRQYRARIRVKNLAVAPAASVTVTIPFVSVTDYSEAMVEVTGSRGSQAAGAAAPVVIATAPSISQSADTGVTPLLGTASATNLAASATYTETGVNVIPTSGRRYMRRRIMVAHTAGTAPGHLVVEESADNTTYRETRRIPIPSDGLYRIFEVPITHEYMRTKFINGATAQTAFYIRSTAIPFDGAAAMDAHKHLQFVLSTTVLAAGATFNSVGLDNGGNSAAQVHRAVAFADQPGTLNLQQSRDNATWRTTASVAVAAGVAAVLEDKIVMRYLRTQYVNGATLQGAFDLTESILF